MISVQMIYAKNWKHLARFVIFFCFGGDVEFLLNLNADIVCVLWCDHGCLTSNNYQSLRDEEGKKLGLKANEKSSCSKDNDVKMTNAEVSCSLSDTLMYKYLKPFVSATHLTFVNVLHIGIIQWKWRIL